MNLAGRAAASLGGGTHGAALRADGARLTGTNHPGGSTGRLRAGGVREITSERERKGIR